MIRKMCRSQIYHAALADIGNVRKVYYKDKFGDSNAVYGRLMRLSRGFKDRLYLWVGERFQTQIEFDNITSIE